MFKYEDGVVVRYHNIFAFPTGCELGNAEKWSEIALDDEYTYDTLVDAVDTLIPKWLEYYDEENDEGFIGIEVFADEIEDSNGFMIELENATAEDFAEAIWDAVKELHS